MRSLKSFKDRNEALIVSFDIWFVVVLSSILFWGKNNDKKHVKTIKIILFFYHIL